MPSIQRKVPAAKSPPVKSEPKRGWRAVVGLGGCRHRGLASCRHASKTGRRHGCRLVGEGGDVGDRPELAADVAREIGRSDGERQVLRYATASAGADRDGSAALHWARWNSAAYDVPGSASLLYIVLEQIATDDPSVAVSATANALRADRPAATQWLRADDSADPTRLISLLESEK